MSGRSYYCLVAGLPEMVADDKKLAFTPVQFRDMLQEDLHPRDFALAQCFFLPYDHKNLLNLLFHKDVPWDERGNFTHEQLAPLVDRRTFEMADLSFLPGYLTSFINRHYGEEGVTDYFKADMLLTEGYFTYLEGRPNQFVRDVARFDRTLGNILSALNGRKHDIPFEELLMGNDEVTAALIKSKSRDFGLSSDVSDLELLIQIFENENLLDREFKLDVYRWEKLEEMTFFNYFTIERVLAFLLKLFIVERWYLLEKEKGQQLFKKLLKDIESEFQFPEEFTSAYGKKK